MRPVVEAQAALCVEASAATGDVMADGVAAGAGEDREEADDGEEAIDGEEAADGPGEPAAVEEAADDFEDAERERSPRRWRYAAKAAIEALTDASAA